MSSRFGPGAANNKTLQIDSRYFIILSTVNNVLQDSLCIGTRLTSLNPLRLSWDKERKPWQLVVFPATAGDKDIAYFYQKGLFLPVRLSIRVTQWHICSLTSRYLGFFPFGPFYTLEEWVSRPSNPAMFIVTAMPAGCLQMTSFQSSPILHVRELDLNQVVQIVRRVSVPLVSFEGFTLAIQVRSMHSLQPKRKTELLQILAVWLKFYLDGSDVMPT